MEKKILLVGLGNIGLRHLEGIISSKKKYTIYLYDKNKKQYAMISKFIEKNRVQIHKFFFLNDINEIKFSDVLILATNSTNRFDLLKNILKTIKIKYLLLEKVVFLDQITFSKAINLLEHHKIDTWVNCIRREVRFYNLLKKKIKNQSFKITFTGYKWGMASNLIHFIDLFFFISNGSNIKFTTNFRDKKYQTKRKGFFDIMGKVKIKDDQKNQLILHDDKKYKHNELKIFFNNNYYLIYRNEVFFKNNYSKKLKKIDHIDDEKVSIITSKILNKIFQKKKLFLSDIKSSYNYHNLLFSIINQFIHDKKIKKLKYT